MSDRPYRRGGGGRPEPEPKPFGKVVLTRGWSRRINPRDKSHDRFAKQSYTGKLQCVLRAMTPLHIGSGIYELEGDDPARGLITDAASPSCRELRSKARFAPLPKPSPIPARESFAER